MDAPDSCEIGAGVELPGRCWFYLCLSLALSCRTPSSPAPTPADAAVCPPPVPPVVIPCDCEDGAEALASKGDDKLTLVATRFSDLPGWAEDHHSEAVPPFLASCERLALLGDRDEVGGPFGGFARDWRPACAAAAALAPSDDAAARSFFETEFRAYAGHGIEGPVGKVTGYYVQALNGSRVRGGAYQFPLYSRPPDLVSIQLSDFIDDGRLRRIWGRVDPASGKVVPYFTRSEIAASLDQKNILFWVDDPVDVLAVEVEGSGKVTLEDGSQVWINFDGKNGRRFRGSGGLMRSLRELRQSHGASRSPATLAAYRDRSREIIDLKDSIVFFEVEPRNGAIGTQEVVLTPRRSLAVDRAVIPLSTPIWLDTRAPTAPGASHGRFQQLLIAQDTGGGILGTVRADIYWGDDRDAAAIGSKVNTSGRMWLLLPQKIRIPQK